MTEHAVAVTGLGVVSCHGAELDAQRDAIRRGHCELKEIDRSDGYHRSGGAQLAALVDPACYRDILPPLKARRMSPPSRFGMVAARRAVEDAELDVEVLASDHGSASTAVVFGTSFGPSSYSERILRQILLESPQAASPMLFTESVANAPAAQVALALKCKGPNVTVTQREASTLLAVAEGAALVRSGRVRRALVGGVEELNPLLHSILDRFGALASRRGSASAEVARPLDRNRSGFVAAEGAAVAVLERLADAEARAARVRCVVGPVARAFDPLAPVTGWSKRAPRTAARLAREWHRKGTSSNQADAVPLCVLGSNGSPLHDVFEAGLLRDALALPAEGRPPKVATPKASFGEQGMATLAGALLLLEGVQPTTPPAFEIDPAIGMVPHQFNVEAEIRADRRLLLSAAAAGGSCCWLGLDAV